MERKKWSTLTSIPTEEGKEEGHRLLELKERKCIKNTFNQVSLILNLHPSGGRKTVIDVNGGDKKRCVNGKKKATM